MMEKTVKVMKERKGMIKLLVLIGGRGGGMKGLSTKCEIGF